MSQKSDSNYTPQWRNSRRNCRAVRACWFGSDARIAVQARREHKQQVILEYATRIDTGTDTDIA